MHRLSIILIGVCLFPILLMAQPGKVNQTDETGWKQGLWRIVNKEGKFLGFEEGQLYEEGHYQDNRKIGIWIQYYPNGRKKNEITYKNGRPYGPAKFYYPNGNLWETGTWKSTRWVGEYKLYHPNGKVYYDWKYNERGMREGEQKYYHANGQVMIEGNWIDGKEYGVVKEYYANGEVRSERTFMDGIADHSKTVYYEAPTELTASKEEVLPEVSSPTEFKAEKKNKPTGSASTVGMFDKTGEYSLKGRHGKVTKEGYFENGTLMNGKTYKYDNSGELTKTLIIKDGQVVETILPKDTVK